MRQEKTHKIVANFYVIQQQGLLCVLAPQKTSDKAWIWDCCDASDDKPQIDKLCAKFTSIEGLFHLFKTSRNSKMSSKRHLNIILIMLSKKMKANKMKFKKSKKKKNLVEIIYRIN